MNDSQRKAMFANNQRIRKGIQIEIDYAKKNEEGWHKHIANNTTSPMSVKEARELSTRFGSMKRALQRASDEVDKADEIIEHGSCTKCHGSGRTNKISDRDNKLIACNRCGGTGSAKWVHGELAKK